MISPKELVRLLGENGIDFFTGVPDSLLKDLCSYLRDNYPGNANIITANEGNAIALAAGHYLSTGKIGAVYMQNSGLGNCVNPLTSLTDSLVYKIPLLMIIGWRGEPGVKDEPQHVKQGQITPQQLELLGVPFRILSAEDNTEKLLSEIIDALKESGAPVALLIKKGAIDKYKSLTKTESLSGMKREESLSLLLDRLHKEDIVIGTTGKTSREIYELRASKGMPQRDFLCVGSMGHASSIALGVAMNKPERRVVCFDGDGALLMHLGALPIIGAIKPTNFVHIVLNNAAHESVGGQPTVAGNIDLKAIATACGYQQYFLASDPHELDECWNKLKSQKGPIFFEIRTGIGSREDLGRPVTTPEQNKTTFMEHVRG